MVMNGRKESKGKYIFASLLILISILFIVGEVFAIQGLFRLDQNAVTILSTTAGIIGTMFGLTAASYAFIWGDLRSDSQENCHLVKVLERYSKELWNLFVFSLVFTALVIITTLIGLVLVQNITNPSLFKRTYIENSLVFSYYNEKHKLITAIVIFNLALSAAALDAMVRMNWVVFTRNMQYAAIAKSILNQIKNKYDTKIESPEEKDKNSDSIEYEKLHNLEILVERILKNHESIGNAFAEAQRREKLLTAVIINRLTATYGENIRSEGNKSNSIDVQKWGGMGEKKCESRWNQCIDKAKWEYELTQKGRNVTGRGNYLPKPCDSSFITVYEDLLLYRDNSLVWEEMHRKNGNEEKAFIEMYERRALRYTIKKRLLTFYLQGETFDNMDLSGVSFSGADLRFSNFSNCNLTKIRLKGTNCEGADFTRSKMTGMYFADASEGEVDGNGEIQLSCIDEESEEWDPYRGREITYLKDATFKEADISRAYLNAPGKLIEGQSFPFSNLDKNELKLENKTLFSLEGTNFDYAKMFFSYFKNINLKNASLEKAQMYNVAIVQTKAKSANFSAATMTNACLAWCDFENADFSDVSLAEAILVRINFNGASMKNINFSYSNIVACNFEGASCQNASFKNIIQDLDSLNKEQNSKYKALREIDLGQKESLKFGHTTLTSADFSGAELNETLFQNTIGQNCIFTKARGEHAIFENSIFNSSVFNSTRFDRSKLKNTVMRNAVCSDSQFINCTFENVDFSNSLFTGLNNWCFSGGIMDNVNFSNTKGLTSKCFCNICLNQVNFSGTGIQKEDFLCNVKIINCLF